MSPLQGDSGSSSPPATEGGAPSPPAPEGGTLSIDERCVRNDLGPVPPAPAACPRMACVPAGTTCSKTGLAQTLRSQIQACGGRCGDVAVAFSSGCASDVRFFLPSDPRGDTIEACIRQLVLGKAWECAAPNGWATVYIGRCTTP